MLAAGGETAYISEPLNVLHRPGVMGAPTHYWYTYICPENEADYLPAFKQTLQYRYHLLAELKALRSWKDLGRMGRDSSIFIQGKIRRQRPLLKDPFAVFSIPWFIERLGCQVVVTLRHPAAFASSLKRLDWPFQLQDLLAQPLLMRAWLEPFRENIEYLLAAEKETGAPDILAQGSLLWCMVYTVVDQVRTRHPLVHVVRHEDLSLEPLRGFANLYSDLGLKFTDRAQKTILAASSADNPKEVPRKKTYSVHLDSRANLHNWKKRLSPAEIQRVRQLTGDLAQKYYPDINWD
jgi:hypothetical protein